MSATYDEMLEVFESKARRLILYVKYIGWVEQAMQGVTSKAEASFFQQELEKAKRIRDTLVTEIVPMERKLDMLYEIEVFDKSNQVLGLGKLSEVNEPGWLSVHSSER